MSLIKETLVDKIEILENLDIQVRTVTRIVEDGKILSKSYHRHVCHPGTDIRNEDLKVQAIAKAIWPAYN